MDTHLTNPPQTESAPPLLPSPSTLSTARRKLLPTLPQTGLGPTATATHLRTDILPALNRSSQSPNYYGFVTGGCTPAAALADNLVTATDQNVQVHLPEETLSTEVEDRALRMVCEIMGLAPGEWGHRTFTTGATASNVVGLACGREFVVAEAAARKGRMGSVADKGIFGAMRAAGLEEVVVLTTVPHSSLRKAASLVGLGRSCVIDVGKAGARHLFDFEALEEQLVGDARACIVAVSAAEVNTGFFATQDYDDMARLRELCDRYGAWLHIDAAFGLLARLLPSGQGYDEQIRGVAGLELADSITGDAHKLLNVPYDTGIFLSRHLSLGQSVFQNSGAAYLTPVSNPTHPNPDTSPSIPSPLNIGIENSRRFRALPVYATLTSYGRQGYLEMLERQIALARGIARFVGTHASFELLPAAGAGVGLEERLGKVFIVVLFRAREAGLNEGLVGRINGSGRVYVSGTVWEGRPACRFAVANWAVHVERDLEVVRSVLEELVAG
ncbi:hypothetical protein MBLNU230_g1456t1 [Neophaeotheca triangularis]